MIIFMLDTQKKGMWDPSGRGWMDGWMDGWVDGLADATHRLRIDLRTSAALSTRWLENLFPLRRYSVEHPFR